MRQNIITKQWVLFATGRGKRPNDFQKSEGGETAIPHYDAKCPFCPGNERLLPPIIHERPVMHFTGGMQSPADRTVTAQNTAGGSVVSRNRTGKLDAGSSGIHMMPWQARVVPNKFPIVIPDADREVQNIGFYAVSGGYGCHEVVIESPFHDRDLPGMSESEVEAVVRTYLYRYDELTKKDADLEVYIFRNHGARSGTSLIHPHSQIIAIPALSDRRRQLVNEAGQYFEERGGCVFCEVMRFEKEQKVRVLYENGLFLCIVPFAAQVPFEVWVLPKTHKSSFNDIEETEMHDFSDALRYVLGRLYHRLGDPDYNYIIQSFSADGPDKRALHWHLQILPKLTIPAGFEIASGISVNPFLPEENCAFLKGE